MGERSDIRNLAIISHVDHGKTSIVQAMLQQSNVFGAHEEVLDRVMDSTDQERERGITILAKNASIHYQGVKINIVDTPGHADFGGEVERGLTMVDGVLLLVDASEGPLPQTRFVLRKALERGLPVILVINKIDRPDARISEVLNEVYELFLDLDAPHIDFPVLYTNARAGNASTEEGVGGTDMRPLFEAIVHHVPAPTFQEGHALQALVTNLDSSPYVGRLALCRIHNGEVRKGETVAWCRRDGTTQSVKITELYLTEGMERVDADVAGPGEIVAVAGIPEITIGETIADAASPEPLPILDVDEPALGMTLGINNSPLAGRSGNRLTARMIKDRLDAELVGNVSIRVLDTERPDTWEVQGRGELQLAVLVESMRREGFELTVGKPRVITREVDGKTHEPIERVSIDVPEDFLGTTTQLMALRKGRLEQMVNHGTGWVRLEYLVPARGLIGFRTGFLTETRGSGIMHSVFEHYEPWAGEIKTRAFGSLVADRSGKTASYAIMRMQERGQMFIGPGEDVYEGMIVGANARADDLDVNAIHEKKQTNIRSANADDMVNLVPAHYMSLDQALEFIRADECVEVTPDAIRMRKVTLSQTARAKGARSIAS